MIPPELSTATDATVQLAPGLAQDGSMRWVVVIKQRFSVDGSGQVGAVDGAEVRFTDEPWDEDHPERSSIKYPSDICARKPSTDVLVVGNALAPGRSPVSELDVLVRVGPVQRKLRVFGVRVWRQTLTGGLDLTPPQPFEEVPLRWENAYGGMDTSNSKKPAFEPRNPHGRGVAADPSLLVHQLAPQVEDPGDLIKNHRSRPAPAGVGPVAPHALPRSQYSGTYDDCWQKERMPLPPLDFDERHNQVSPPELIAPTYLRGGENVQLVNLCEDGPLQFELPKRLFIVHPRGASGRGQEYRPPLDTVLLEPNARQFELTWRTAVPAPKATTQLTGIEVFEKEFI